VTQISDDDKENQDEENPSDEEREDTEEGEETEEEERPRQTRLRRDLRALGIAQNRRNERDSYDEDTALAVYSAISSNPGEPSTFEEVFNGPSKEKWRKAIHEELSNFAKRGVWKMVNRDQMIKNLKRKPIKTKWVFKKQAQ
jgi:hypothetical protein